jgi:ribonuclease R
VTPAEAAAARPVVCEVSRRGRFLVAEPFFEVGPTFTLGRRGSVEAREGALVAVLPRSRGRATLVADLGRPDDVRAVLHGVAVEAGAVRPFPAPVDDELASLPRDPLPTDPARVDLRDRLTFTIDPPDAKDFDDAVSPAPPGSDACALVHISDVAAFTPPGGAIDREAARRGTSVYLPGRVEPMLPPLLSNRLCSLEAGRDRYAVTVELGGERPAMYRSVIRSDHRLSYPQAEAILAGAEAAPPPLLAALREVAAYAGDLRRRRFARGALALCTSELELRFDEHGVADAWLAGEAAAHALVEDLMIAANEAVAELLAGARRPALYRVHPPPDPGALDALVDRLEALDVPTPPMPALHTGGDAAAYAARVSEAVCRYVEASGRGREIYPALVLRALQQARYDPRNLGHSGLASEAYAHFTSPIRRYPDLVCHRALLQHLGAADGQPPGIESALPELAAEMSAAEREATRIERRGDDVCLAFLLERRMFERGWDEPFAGMVSGFATGAVFVRFDDVFEGMLPARFLGGDHFDLDEPSLSMIGRATGRRVRLGDRIDVRVRSVDRARGRVLLEGGAPPA